MAGRVVIIGAGIAGLAAALRLRAEGWDVEVLERQPLLGGKIHRVEHDGYAFDAGPSFLTQPHRLEELFALFGERLDEHLAIAPVDPSVRYWWPDGTTVCTPRDRDALVAELAKLGAEPASIRAYLDEIARQYDSVAAPFVDDDITRPQFWLHPRTVGRLVGSVGMLGRTFHGYNRGWFADSPKLVQLLCRYATYAGNDPYQTPAFMTSIADVELRQGIWYPEDGLRSVPEALIALGRRHGVRYTTDAEVTAIQHDGRAVSAVEVNGEPVAADVFVSAIDPQHIAPWLGRPRSTVPRALSALIWFAGVDAVPGIGLHNLFFADDYEGEFARLSAGEPGDDPTIYVNASSVMSPSHAPAGKQNWFVMINAPADTGQDWPALQARLRPLVFAKLERLLGHPVVVHSESTYAPPDIARTSGAFAGSIYGPAGNRLLDLFRKQPATDPQLANLYYCGGSSHPGGGIPMCLSSAHLAVRKITHSAGV
ncbi:MAG: phytoene desaturase family protein [Myxococcota bacterium]